MKKKIIALVVCLTMAMIPMLTACGGGGGGSDSADKMKVGLVCLHDENSGYDRNFIEAFEASCEKMGVEGIIKKNIPEGQECYDAMGELVDEGCTLVISDSFGHESYVIQAAKDNPDVQFVSCTGQRAHTEGLDNFHNAFATIHEGRYLAGVVAGMKLKEMIDKGEVTVDKAKVGYVAAMPYEEVKSGYTSWFLGLRSIVPEATMDVTFTGSWLDETAEKEGANKLIEGGCVLISQHADSMGAPTACELAGVPNVSYNGSTISVAPKTYLVSSKINWSPFYETAIAAVQNGEEFDNDYIGNLTTDSVQLTELNEDAVAEGTQEKLDEVMAGIKDGTIHPYDTSTFTVGGKQLDEETLADVDQDENFTPDTKVVSDGYYHESELRSAPYFGLDIDGINLLN